MSAVNHPNDTPEAPMVFPPWLERLQIKYFNPAVRPLARRLPTFAIVKHRGRTSGTRFFLQFGGGPYVLRQLALVACGKDRLGGLSSFASIASRYPLIAS